MGVLLLHKGLGLIPVRMARIFKDLDMDAFSHESGHQLDDFFVFDLQKNSSKWRPIFGKIPPLTKSIDILAILFLNLMQQPLYPKLSIETLDAKIHSGRAEVGATRFDPSNLLSKNLAEEWLEVKHCIWNFLWLRHF